MVSGNSPKGFFARTGSPCESTCNEPQVQANITTATMIGHLFISSTLEGAFIIHHSSL